MSRLTPQQEWERTHEFIQAHSASQPYPPKQYPATVACKCGAEITGVSEGTLIDTFVHHVVFESMRERDEAILGAYRAAELAAMKEPFRAHRDDDVDFHSGCVQTRDRIAKALRGLTPQSALDAVERDRREIAEAALQTERSYQRRMNHWSGTEDDKPPLPTAADVLAKVGRGR